MNVRQAHITAIGQDASEDSLRIEVSAFIDNELDDASADRVVDALLASDQLAEFWTNAHRAGDWMRSEEVVDVGDGDAFLRRFSSRLAAEPAIIAATPESILVSAKCTIPTPQPRRTTPSPAAASASRRGTRRERRRSARTAARIVAAARNRVPAVRKGGSVRTAILIPRYVDPQTT